MILAYHRINPYYKNDALTVSPVNFERQIVYLLNKGFKPFLPDKNRIEPADFLITFDDGYADNLWYAKPILDKYNIKPLIFLTVNYTGTENIFERYKDREKDRFLNWGEIKQMANEGIIFGSHSLSHPHLSSIGDKRLWDELSVSKKIIEEKTGKDVPCFCYPYGDFNKRIIERVKEAGYKSAFVTSPKGVKIQNTDYTLLRTGVYGHNNLLIFRIKIWKSLKEKRYSF